MQRSNQNEIANQVMFVDTQGDIASAERQSDKETKRQRDSPADYPPAFCTTSTTSGKSIRNRFNVSSLGIPLDVQPRRS